MGFVKKEDEDELKVKVSNDEVDRLIKAVSYTHLTLPTTPYV